MKPFIILALLSALASGRRQNRLEDLNEQQADEIRYWVGAIHYFWQGFQIDLYHADPKKLDSRCFDEESEDEIAQLYYTLIVNRSFENFFDSGITLINLFYDDYVVCHYDDALTIFVSHCKKNETVCRVDSLLENLEANVFRIISVATSIGDIFENYEITSAEEMEEVSLQLGKDASQVAQLLTGMTGTSGGFSFDNFSMGDD